MDITMINKLAGMTANRNALKEEILGLHSYINKLHKKVGLKPLFKDLPSNQAIVTDACTLDHEE